MTISDEEFAEQQSAIGRIRAPSRLRVVAGRFFGSLQGRIGFALLGLMFLLAFVGPYSAGGPTPTRTSRRSSSRRPRATGGAPCRRAPTSTR